MCLLCWCHVPGTGAVPCPVCVVVLSDGAAPFPCVVQTRTVAGAPVSAETCAAGWPALAPPSVARSSRRLRTSTLRVQATRPRTDRDTGKVRCETTATHKQRHARRPSYILVLHHARGCHAHPSCPTATVREHQAKPSCPYQWARPRGFSALNTTKFEKLWQLVGRCHSGDGDVVAAGAPAVRYANKSKRCVHLVTPTLCAGHRGGSSELEGSKIGHMLMATVPTGGHEGTPEPALPPASHRVLRRRRLKSNLQAKEPRRRVVHPSTPVSQDFWQLWTGVRLRRDVNIGGDDG